MNRIYSVRHDVRGFSLIEVLIAVLVLSTGMLALAALQATLTRNSVEAKARSQAMALAVEIAENTRSAASRNSSQYSALAVGPGVWADWTSPVGTAPDNSNSYQTRVDVTRFVRSSVATACGGAANTPCFVESTATGAVSTTTAEFKRLDVSVRWTDAAGDSRLITVTDVVSSATDDKSDAVKNMQAKNLGGVGAPVARISRPNEIGMIPIAVSADQDTSASNPKPVLTGRERGRTDETQFQIQTYSDTADPNTVTLDRYLDVRVLGCRCELGALPPISSGGGGNPSVAEKQFKNPFFRIPQQPAYWNGSSYVISKNIGIGTDRGYLDLDHPDQNPELCFTCCLDRHEVAGQERKFDPFAPASISANKYNPYGTSFVAASGNGADYVDSCKFIRVDGVFRVTTDANLDLMNFLETQTGQSQSVPTSSATTSYQSLVIDFLKAKYGAANHSDPIGAGGLGTTYASILTQPANIAFNSASDPNRFLHNRGLYVDYIEPEARAAIAADCPSSMTSAQLQICLLKHLPFFSINTTDIAQWVSQAGISVVNVSNQALNSETEVSRGYVDPIAVGTETVAGSMQRSNTGLADTYPIDVFDAAVSDLGATPPFDYSAQRASDSQLFTVGNGGGGGSILSSFDLNLTVPTNNNSGVTWAGGAVVTNWLQASFDVGCNWVGGDPLVRKCASNDLNLESNVRLRVSKYNVPGTPVDTSTTCVTGSPASSPAIPLKKAQCFNFAVSSVTKNGVQIFPGAPSPVVITGTEGRSNEVTTIDLGVMGTTTPSVIVGFSYEGKVDGEVQQCTNCNGNGRGCSITPATPSC